MLLFKKAKLKDLNKVYNEFTFNVDYDTFKTICSDKRVTNILIYNGTERIGFLSYQYNPATFLMYIHYFAKDFYMSAKDIVYAYLVNSGLFVIFVAYFRQKTQKQVCFKLRYTGGN